MRKTDTLLWHVHTAEGELIAATRYAYAAAEMALRSGRGAKVDHCGLVVLDVQERSTAWDAADAAAKVMIELAHSSRRAA